MTFLADLSYLEKNFAAFQTRTNRQFFERKTFSDDIFSEGTRLEFRAACFEVVDFALTEQTNLPMPIARVSVAASTKFFCVPRRSLIQIALILPMSQPPT